MMYYILHCFCFVFAFCLVSLQGDYVINVYYNGGLLLDIILLT